MGLNEVDKHFCKDTELQNYTKTGVKRIINLFVFQNNFPFSPQGKTCIQDIFEDFPDVTVRSKIIKRSFSQHSPFFEEQSKNPG